MSSPAFGTPELGRKRLRIANGNEVPAEPLNQRVEIESRAMAAPLRLAICTDAVVARLEAGECAESIHCLSMASHVDIVHRCERRALHRQFPRLLDAGLDKQRDVSVGHQRGVLAPDLGHEGCKAGQGHRRLTSRLMRNSSRMASSSSAVRLVWITPSFMTETSS